MPEIASMCVSLENESERVTVIKYIFLIVFSVLPKFYVKTNKRQVKKTINLLSAQGGYLNHYGMYEKNIHSCKNKRSKSLLKGSQSNK